MIWQHTHDGVRYEVPEVRQDGPIWYVPVRVHDGGAWQSVIVLWDWECGGLRNVPDLPVEILHGLCAWLAVQSVRWREVQRCA